MFKRVLATLLAAALILCTAGSALAFDPVGFKTVLAQSSSLVASPVDALKDENRAKVASLLFLEYILYQNRNGQDMEARPVWKDCLISAGNGIVQVWYDLGGGCMLILYNIEKGMVSVVVNEGTPLEMDILAATLMDQGYPTSYVVDGEEWSNDLILTLKLIAELAE